MTYTAENEVETNNSRRNFFIYTGLGVLGLLAGGTTAAMWKGEAPFGMTTLMSGALSLQKGTVTRWERHYDYYANADSTTSATEWKQIGLNDPLKGSTENIWLTDLTLVNDGENMVADMQTNFGNGDYLFYQPEENVRILSKQWSGMLVNRLEHTVEGLNTITTPNVLTTGKDPFTVSSEAGITTYQKGYLTQSGGKQIDESYDPDNPPSGSGEEYIIPLKKLEIPKGTTNYTFALGGSRFITQQNADNGNISALSYAQNRPLVDIGTITYDLNQVVDQ